MVSQPDELLSASARRFFDAVNAAAVTLHPGGTIRDANPRFAELMRVAHEQLAGQPFEGLVAPEDRALYRGLVEASRGPRGSTGELALAAGDDRRFVHVFLRRLQRPKSEVILLLAFDVTRHRVTAERLWGEKVGLEARVQERTAELAALNEELRAANAALEDDIRKREAVESALLRSEAKWRKLFKASPVVIVVSTLKEGRILEVNETFLGTLGYRREEVIGRRVTDLGLWQDVEDRTRWASALLARRAVRNIEATFLTTAGTPRIGLISSELLEMDGELCVLSVVLDITEQKRAEQMLAAQKALLEGVLEQAADGLVVFDLHRRVFLANSTARKLVGNDPRGEVLESARTMLGETGAGDRSLPPEEDPVSRALRGEPCVGREVEIGHASGPARSFLVSALPLLDEREQIVGAVSTFAEITHLRRTLEEQAIVLRETNHRLRNNLQMLSSLLGMQSDASTSEEARVALEESQLRVHSMARLHDQLARSSPRAPVRMPDYLRALAAALEECYGRPGIALTLAVGDVALDADRANAVGLAVTELVTNAFRHGFPAGRTGEIAVALHQRQDRCVLTVRDTGVGIPPGTDVEHPASLGLRLVQLLVARIHGSLDLRVSGGAAFTVTFPVQSAP